MPLNIDHLLKMISNLANFFDVILQSTNVSSTMTQAKSNIPLFSTSKISSTATTNVKPLNSDLNSSLSLLIDNLDMNNRATALKKDHE
ncbi:unnamed protein product [Didymodactylos carnosus]|uniref:Uncharacterized protein n=1 Tax=Didymodactylos carnosus TaxID=1234261 RepID=A0A814NRM7_9BILA|nr:unnamed protein product [Didymodactylos carnosus]CAF3860462.1 unnamed protein product [Didymodactylos carnosus]